MGAVPFSLREPGEPLRLIWSGLHLPRKALPLLLRALAEKRDWGLGIGDWKAFSLLAISFQRSAFSYQ